MAHPYKSAGHKNDPKWFKRAEGGMLPAIDPKSFVYYDSPGRTAPLTATGPRMGEISGTQEPGPYIGRSVRGPNQNKINQENAQIGWEVENKLRAMTDQDAYRRGGRVRKEKKK